MISMADPCSEGDNGQSAYGDCISESPGQAALTGIPVEPIDIRSVVRRMRGGSQAYLVEGSDGRFYVAKFTGNPQGNRTLINECVAYHLLQQLQVSTPALRILRLSEEIRDKAGLCFSVGERTISVQPGLHLGSQCPVNPTTTAIFDFLPRKLLPNVINLGDFAKAFVVDKLLGQTDARQCIFVRDRLDKTGLAFRAYMIDHGWIFAANRWEFQDCSRFGLYLDSTVYSMLDMLSQCRQIVEIVRRTDESGFYAAATNIPSTWFAESDYDGLVNVFTTLVNRVARLDSLICYHLGAIVSKRDQAVDAGAGNPAGNAYQRDSCTPNLRIAPETC